MEGGKESSDSSPIDSDSSIPDSSSESDNVVSPQQESPLDQYLGHISKCPVCRGFTTHPSYVVIDNRCREGTMLAVAASQDVTDEARAQLAAWQEQQQQSETE